MVPGQMLVCAFAAFTAVLLARFAPERRAGVPDNGYIALLVGVAAAVTWALAGLPFAALAPMRHSAVVKYLSACTCRSG